MAGRGGRNNVRPINVEKYIKRGGTNRRPIFRKNNVCDGWIASHNVFQQTGTACTSARLKVCPPACFGVAAEKPDMYT